MTLSLPRALLAPLTALAATSPLDAQAQGFPPTTTAQATTSDFPDASGRFEKPTVTGHEYDPVWAPWNFDPFAFHHVPAGSPAVVSGSGIAHNNSSLLTLSENAPDGRRVAFLHGLGTARCSFTFPSAGLWKLRFQAAQRVRTQGPDVQVLRVTVAGENVFELQLPDGEYAEYATAPFRVQPGALGPKEVVFAGLVGSGDHIALFDEVLLDPIPAWNDASSWDNGIPDATDDVYIPPGVAVEMDGACVAKSVQCQGVLMAHDQDGSLTARWILVDQDVGSQDAGHLRVGTEQNPFVDLFEIVLTGENPNEITPGPGTKFLAAAAGGQIDLHGAPTQSWTKLASLDNSFSTAPTTVITVDDCMGWQVNDELVVVFTGYMDTNYQQLATPRSRRCTITAIDATTGALTLDVVLDAAAHCSAPAQTFTAHPGTSDERSWTLDQRAEVGLLSHNVRVVSDLAPESTFGGHVMLMGDATGAHGVGRFSNVELAGLGQKKTLARYPMHWHMQRDNGAGQFIRNCSVHGSFNRAITLHGSNRVAVEDNVCFDHLGHGIFLEDGVEQENQVHRNLVVFTRRPEEGDQLLIHDNKPLVGVMNQPQNRTPAAFWISHPTNHFTGNVAAETVGTGYWFALHNLPTGTSATWPWEPLFAGVIAMEAPLGSFADNVSHSCKSAFDVNDSLRDHPVGQEPFNTAHVTPWDPLDDFIWRNRSWDPSGALYDPQTIQRFTAYGCTTGIYAGEGSGSTFTDEVTFTGCVLADNGGHMQVACSFILEDSVLVYDTGNGIFGTQSPDPFQQGFAQVVYDGPFRMFDCHLVGYDGAGARLFFDKFGAARRHPNHLVEDLSFDGGLTPVVKFGSFPTSNPLHNVPEVWGIAIHDVDGSLSNGQYPAHTLITNHPMMHLTGSAGTPDVLLGENAWLSPFKFGHLQLYSYQNTTNWLVQGDLPGATFLREQHLGWDAYTYTSGQGGQQIRQLPVIVRPAQASGPDFIYAVTLQHGPNHAVNRVDVAMDDLDTGDVTRLSLTFPQVQNWSPAVYLNDAGSSDPSQWTQLAPGQNPGITSYTAEGGVVSLEMVNTGRTHRVTLSW